MNAEAGARGAGMKPRQHVGKYRLLRRVGRGAFVEVWRALDVVEGVPVALKIPAGPLATPTTIEALRTEVRLISRLEHPHILPIKNATYVDERLIVAYPLGVETLAERLQRRLVQDVALDYAGQLLDGLAFAHRQRIIHCDVKPENLILFPGNRLRLTDFGISKVAFRTMQASGSGTVGYIAPEQAMGKPSFRSDVFSAGLVIWRMLAGELPEWPYAWPLPGHPRLRRKAHPELIAFLRRALRVEHRKRFADAVQMEAAFRKILPRSRAWTKGRARRRNGRTATAPRLDWSAIRRKQFLAAYRDALRSDGACGRCGGPIAHTMAACPWCGAADRLHHDGAGFPAACPRCGGGRKLDWRYCAWCYGPRFEAVSDREYGDRRYTARCANPDCGRRALMPFSRYCPWCRAKVRKAWSLPGSSDRCPRCRWGVARGFWDWCPWCGKRLGG